METFELKFVSSVYVAYICARFKNLYLEYSNDMTEKKSKKLHELLTKSRVMFMRYGVKTLTMDDIAKEMGISKKTIYQFVSNKAELVKLTVDDYLEEEKRQMDAILSGTGNSVEEMIEMVAYFLNVVREFNAASLYDLQKHYPETWQILNEYRFQYIRELLVQNINTGIKQGDYRADIDADIISKIYLSAIEILYNQNLFPNKKYPFIKIYREFMNYHLCGILTDKGKAFLDKTNLLKN